MNEKFRWQGVKLEVCPVCGAGHHPFTCYMSEDGTAHHCECGVCGAEGFLSHPDDEPGNKLVSREYWDDERGLTVTEFYCDKPGCNCVGAW